MPASLSPGASIQVDLGLPLLQAQGGRGRGGRGGRGREGRDERRTEATGTQYRRNRHFHDYTTTSAACMPCQLNCLHSKCTTLQGRHVGPQTHSLYMDWAMQAVSARPQQSPSLECESTDRAQVTLHVGGRDNSTATLHMGGGATLLQNLALTRQPLPSRCAIAIVHCAIIATQR